MSLQSLISYKLRLRYAAILIKSAGVALALSAGGAQANDGYFVIVASFPTDTSDAEVARQARDLAYVRATAARCHLHAYNDFAVKFGGNFRPGYIVFVLGDGRSFANPQRRQQRGASGRPMLSRSLC
jgi:hypothetical protein